MAEGFKRWMKSIGVLGKHFPDIKSINRGWGDADNAGESLFFRLRLPKDLDLHRHWRCWQGYSRNGSLLKGHFLPLVGQF